MKKKASLRSQRAYLIFQKNKEEYVSDDWARFEWE